MGAEIHDLLMAAVDSYIPTPERDDGQAVPDADRGRVHDHGSRHGGDGQDRARDREGGRQVEILGSEPKRRRRR
jgi:translation elongation factor EF-Tu-like GTPase